MALGSLGTSTWAAPVDLSSGSAGFFSTPVAGGFSDLYTFTLATAQTVNVLLSSVMGGGQDVDFTSVVLAGSGGTTFNAVALTSDPFESWVIANASLGAGSYTLAANGTNSAARGGYAGTIALSGSSAPPPGVGGGPLDLSSGSTGFAHTLGAGGFSDGYTFTLSSSRAVNVMFSAVAGGSQDLDLTDIRITGPSGTFTAENLTADPFENWTLRTPLLAPGNYTLTAAGTNGGAAGTYVGSLAVSDTGPTEPNPVPEPASAALVLAGLGAALATMRRRKPGVGSPLL
ncbi:hypothetical protein ASF43_20275 [Pseudorhodoferax sp. Leaf267]|nr:hypothetical protein ASF43_20275 [Pseudorhodoferax sp. Leaf267]